MTMTKKIRKVFLVFESNYQEIPLERFKKNPYKVLVSTMLSSRTKDETTLDAALRLFKFAPDIEKLYNLKTNKVEKLIYPVGFYKTKAKQLKKLSYLIITKHQGKIPDKREELMLLPGVGRKTANLILNRSFDIPAIAVDTHVHRISNLLGLIESKTPRETEIKLEKILPKKYWAETNRLFVSIGKQYNTNKKLLSFFEKERITLSRKRVPAFLLKQ